MIPDGKNLFSNKLKIILHGFFYSSGMGISEPSTILPLIINYFTASNVIIGLFSSLLRGGSILMQLWAAFTAQAYPRVLKYLRIVFLIRFLAWFSIGLVLFFFSETHPSLALWLFGILLFIFSFAAGFGTIYFQELMGKLFSATDRGKLIATRQFFSGLGYILSGLLAAYVLQHFQAPHNFAYLFLISAFAMGIGYTSVGFLKETEKKKIQPREQHFSLFFAKMISLLKTNKMLRYQVFARVLAFGFMFVAPFIILQAKEKFELTGWIVGSFVSMQMVGAMLSDFLWGYLSGKNKNLLVARLSFVLMILSIALSSIAKTPWLYTLIFMGMGAANDGIRLSFQNLILIVAPEKQRPVYVAIQNNISAFGLFFSIPGGLLVTYLGFNFTLTVAIFLMLIGFYLTLRLRIKNQK